MEKIYTDLTLALQEHTKALNAFVKASGGKPAAAGATTAEAAKPKATTKPKAITLETIQERFGAYMSVTDKEERKVRKAKIQTINDHFGVERVSLVDAEFYEEALGYLDQLEAGKAKIKFAAKPEAEEDGEGDNGDSPI